MKTVATPAAPGTPTTRPRNPSQKSPRAKPDTEADRHAEGELSELDPGPDQDQLIQFLVAALSVHQMPLPLKAPEPPDSDGGWYKKIQLFQGRTMCPSPDRAAFFVTALAYLVTTKRSPKAAKEPQW